MQGRAEHASIKPVLAQGSELEPNGKGQSMLVLFCMYNTQRKPGLLPYIHRFITCFLVTSLITRTTELPNINKQKTQGSYISRLT